MADTGQQSSSEVDPRRRVAQRYMESARAELAAKEAEGPALRRGSESHDRGNSAAGLLPSLSASTFVHAILLAIAVTLAALAMVWCYVLLDSVFVAGRVVTLPTAVLVFGALSYGSAFYLGVVETTSHGFTSPDDTLRGSWQDWFWLLPATLGIVAAAAGIGWLLSLPFPGARWEVIGVATALLYPIMQLSMLETGSALAPFSLAVIRTLGTRPLAWITFYAMTWMVFALVALVARVAWRDPPYATMVVMGPVTIIALLAYGLLLGTLARWFAVKGR